jgi:hypothetical protein
MICLNDLPGRPCLEDRLKRPAEMTCRPEKMRR